MSLLHVFRHSPLIHCPSLCPHDPPAELFDDDYDPARESAFWSSCFERCSTTSEHERPCLVEFDRRRALARQAFRSEKQTTGRKAATPPIPREPWKRFANEE
jgi:hypothetical protein